MRFAILPAVFVLAASQAYADESSRTSSAPPAQSEPATQDAVPLLVSATCAGCHAVEPGAESPLANTPTFVDIANRDGLTKETLTRYLSDAHNYPDQMDVEVDAADIEVVTDYILSLRTSDYKRDPS